MKSLISLIFVFLVLASCIPLRIAPKIEDHKIKEGRKFKRSLPRQYAFIFEDPKDANEFYHFINAKFDLKHNIVEDNVPFNIGKETFNLSFYEVEIPTKTFNLIPFIIDSKLEQEDYDPLLKDAHFSRIGNWYIALFVTNEIMEDCLNPNSLYRSVILKYLKEMKQEYLNSHNYLEVLHKNDTLQRQNKPINTINKKGSP